VRRLATRSGPISPSRYGSAATRATGVPKAGSGTVGQAAGSLFDFSENAKSKTQAPLGPVSTQGAKRSAQHAQVDQNSAKTQAGTGEKAQIGGGTASLKPKTIKRVADTDWYFVTSVSDARYFYNRKTGETASRLPQSVADHVGRIVAEAENQAVSRQPAKLSPLSSSKTDDSPSSPPASSSSSSLSSSKQAQSGNSHASPSSSSLGASIPDTSLLHTQSSSSTVSASSKSSRKSSPSAASPSTATAQSEEDSPHIKPQNVRLLVSDPDLSIRARGRPVSDAVDAQGMKRFEFTEEEKSARFAELREQYRQNTRDGTELELTEEELDEIMQEEANAVLEETEEDEHDPDSDIPDYLSKIRSPEAQTSAESAPPKKSSPLDNLEETNRGLLDMGDRMILRGQSQQLLNLARNSISRLEERFNNGTPLNMREQAVYINGLLLLAKVHNQLRQWSEATRCLERARLVDPSHPSTHLMAGINHLSAQEYAEAVRCMQKGLEVNPSHIPTLLQLSDTYIDLHEVTTAEDVLQDILYIQPKHYMAMVTMARVLALVGDLEESREYLKKAIVLDETRPEAYVQEARLWLEVQKTNEGLAALGKALEVDKDHGPAFALLGKAFLAQDLRDDAERAYKAALDTNQYLVEALLGLSVIAYGKEQWNDMLRHSSLAVSVDPGALDGWFNKGRAELELKQWQSAISSFEKCLDLDSKAEDVYLFLSNALHGAGRTVESVALMDKVLEMNPGSVKARVNKGFALQALGKATEALALFEDAIVLDPTDQEAKLGKVSALYALGQSEQASSFYSTFKSDASDDAFAAAVQMGDKTQAAEHKAAQQQAGSFSSTTSNLNGSTQDEEEFSFNADLARASMETEKAMKFQPSLDQLQNFSEEDLRQAMDEPSAPPMSPEDVANDFGSELERINQILSKLGVSPLSADPSQISNQDQIIDPSKVPADALKEYQQLLQKLHEDSKANPVPDPQTDEDWQIANSLGLTPETLKRMKELAPDISQESWKEESAKLRKEADELQRTVRRATKARTTEEASGKQSTKKPL